MRSHPNHITKLDFVFKRETKWDPASRSRIPNADSNAFHIEAVNKETGEPPAEIMFGVGRITHASAGFSGDFQPAMNEKEVHVPVLF